MLRDPSARAALLSRVVTPIVERYGRHPRIFAWDIINEPEWATRALGARWWRPAVSLDAMRAFVEDAVALVHRHTDHAATVGSASARYVGAWRALGLDLPPNRRI